MRHLMNLLFETLSTRRFKFLPLLAAGLMASQSLCLAQGPSNRSKPVEETRMGAEEPYFNAQAREVLLPGFLAPDKMSATSIGNVLSLLFDTARVSLQTESDPLTATWVGTITVPTTTTPGKKPKSYLQHIRGSVTKTPDTKVTVFFELGGKGFVAEFPYGMKFEGNILRKFISAIKPGSGARYTATIVIHAERRDSKSALLIDIDGIDVDAR